MTPGGANLGTYSITGASATDWEDIAVGPGPTAGAQYLYMGDIGDNAAVRGSVSVYRVPEPTVSDTQSPLTTSIAGAVRFRFAYPNGPRDAESMFVDPLTKDVYIISKRDLVKYVYRAAYPQPTSGTTTLELVTSLNNAEWITAADISPDGDEIIMRATGVNSGLMYTRPVGGTIADALASTPFGIPLLSEAQGEAIGFDPQGWGYYTTSEGAGAPVHYYNRLPPPAGAVYWDNDGVAAANRVASGAGLGGSGTWNSSALNWYNASSDVAWGGNNDAIFWGTAGTVTLAAAQSVNSLVFKTKGYVITGSTLTLSGPTITVDSGVTATINSVVGGTAGLTKNGNGILRLGGVNTFSGATNVAAGTLTLSKSLTTSSSINVSSGASLSLAAGSAAVIKTAALLTTGTGKVDLTDNKLVVTSPAAIGTLTGSTYSGITGLVQSGRNNGSWNGAGIVTSMPDGLLNRTTLAVANAGEALGLETGETMVWGGQTVTDTYTLVMYTYAGDLNVDGVISADDYALIDLYSQTAGASGYGHGDINYDGAINADDYALIDSNSIKGGPPFSVLAASSQITTLVAVPEPALSAAAVTVLPLLRRRRNRRTTS